MPRLTRAKLMPKYCCRACPVTTAATRALKAGHETPKLNPRNRNAARDGERSGREGHDDAAHELRGGAPQEHRAGAEPVGQGSGRTRDRERDHGDEGHQQPGEVERDAAHLVQVDHREGQRQPATQGLHGDGRQQPATRGWELRPELADAVPRRRLFAHR